MPPASSDLAPPLVSARRRRASLTTERPFISAYRHAWAHIFDMSYESYRSRETLRRQEAMQGQMTTP
jgi:hypothetical protein